MVAPEQWDTVIREAHPGYLCWEEYETNQRRLREGAQAYGADRRHSPAREGPALLQGLLVCGRCGKRMTVRYHARRGRLEPSYLCQRERVEHAEDLCQAVPGVGLDQAVGELLLEVVTPVALEVTLSVQQELQSRAEEADRLRRAQVERAHYEAQLAERRYRHVDPANRLVADSLEADWDQKLRALAEAQQEYERQRQADRGLLSEDERARILALATDFPRLWGDAQTPARERKRMVRLLLEDVTLLRDHHEVTLHLRFKGGARQTLRLPVPPNAWQQRATRPEVVAEMDRLLDDHTDREVATLLNQGGWQSGEGRTFTRRIVARIRRNYGLKSRYTRLREAGLLTLREMAQRLGISAPWVKIWRDQALLKAQPYNDKNECLYEDPGHHPPRKMQGVKLSQRPRFFENPSNRTDEAQCEA